MRKHLSLTVTLFVLLVGGVCHFAASDAFAQNAQSGIAAQIIAREKAATEAWQRKDKAFWMDYMAEDATAFFPTSPYRESDPKTNFFPKFDQYMEMMKVVDYQMYNPHVQVYGDAAILTYNASSMVNMGGRTLSYTSKVTSVYAKQGNTWRVVHTHESMNPGAQ